MKIAFIADGRSDHAIRWIQYFTTDCEVLLISPYECNPIQGVTIVTLPGRFRLTDQLTTTKSMDRKRIPIISKLFSLAVQSRLANQLWSLLKLTDLFNQVGITRVVLRDFQPDVVHAMRVQNEGYIAAFSDADNFIVSSWGSDFIDTAANSLAHRILTKITMKKTAYFMSDCRRDQRLAVHFGLSNHALKYIFPGNGGVDTSIFYSPDILCTTATILYCRGLSHLTKIDTLFEGMSLLKSNTGVVPLLTILAPSATHTEFLECALHHGVSSENVMVLDFVEPSVLANIMRKTKIFVSPLISDGLPNSMLEAMACGMIPVMSDLESIREHITNGVNGFLFDPISPQSLATVLEQAFASTDSSFRLGNVKAISDNSEYYSCLGRVKEIYSGIVKGNNRQ